MPTKPTQLRIPPETLERIDAEAQRRGITRTALILEAVDAHLSGFDAADLIFKANGETMKVTTVPGTSVAFPGFRCPIAGCDWRGGSGTARCPYHSRLAVPI